MDTEDSQTSAKVRTAYDDAAVKTARTQERRIKDIRTVRSGDRDDAFIGTETIHFDEQLVQRLFAFIMSATQSASALTADGIDFIDEYDTWCILLSLGKEIAYAGCADADEHFYEIGTGDGEERNARLSCYSSGKKGLACTWRSDEKNALRNLGADSRITSRIFQEIDDFGKFFLRFVLTCDIIKVDMDLAFACHLRSGLAKAHDASAAALCLVHDPEPYDDKDDDRKK